MHRERLEVPDRPVKGEVEPQGGLPRDRAPSDQVDPAWVEGQLMVEGWEAGRDGLGIRDHGAFLFALRG